MPKSTNKKKSSKKEKKSTEGEKFLDQHSWYEKYYVQDNIDILIQRMLTQIEPKNPMPILPGTRAQPKIFVTKAINFYNDEATNPVQQGIYQQVAEGSTTIIPLIYQSPNQYLMAGLVIKNVTGVGSQILFNNLEGLTMENLPFARTLQNLMHFTEGKIDVSINQRNEINNFPRELKFSAEVRFLVQNLVNLAINDTSKVANPKEDLLTFLSYGLRASLESDLISSDLKVDYDIDVNNLKDELGNFEQVLARYPEAIATNPLKASSYIAFCANTITKLRSLPLNEDNRSKIITYRNHIKTILKVDEDLEEPLKTKHLQNVLKILNDYLTSTQIERIYDANPVFKHLNSVKASERASTIITNHEFDKILTIHKYHLKYIPDSREDKAKFLKYCVGSYDNVASLIKDPKKLNEETKSLYESKLNDCWNYIKEICKNADSSIFKDLSRDQIELIIRDPMLIDNKTVKLLEDVLSPVKTPPKVQQLKSDFSSGKPGIGEAPTDTGANFPTISSNTPRTKDTAFSSPRSKLEKQKTQNLPKFGPVKTTPTKTTICANSQDSLDQLEKGSTQSAVKNTSIIAKFSGPSNMPLTPRKNQDDTPDSTDKTPTHTTTLSTSKPLSTSPISKQQGFKQPASTQIKNQDGGKTDGMWGSFTPRNIQDKKVQTILTTPRKNPVDISKQDAPDSTDKAPTHTTTLSTSKPLSTSPISKQPASTQIKNQDGGETDGMWGSFTPRNTPDKKVQTILTTPRKNPIDISKQDVPDSTDKAPTHTTTLSTSKPLSKQLSAEEKISTNKINSDHSKQKNTLDTKLIQISNLGESVHIVEDKADWTVIHNTITPPRSDSDSGTNTTLSRSSSDSEGEIKTAVLNEIGDAVDFVFYPISEDKNKALSFSGTTTGSNQSYVDADFDENIDNILSLCLSDSDAIGETYTSSENQVFLSSENGYRGPLSYPSLENGFQGLLICSSSDEVKITGDHDYQDSDRSGDY